MVGELLKKQRFSLQANGKTREGADNPDRDAQFRVVNEAGNGYRREPAGHIRRCQEEGIGRRFQERRPEWRRQGDPEEVRVHDFLIKELGRAVPYGIYDMAANPGWVAVGVDNDTAAFAVQTIRRWWREVGRIRYPLARRLVITADGGESNGSRVRLWKLELQRLADELGLSIEVHHLPPGTSKGNKIEHRLFSFITQNWRAKPLISYRVIVELDRGDDHANRLDRPLRTRRQNISKRKSSYPTSRCKPSTSLAIISTANGTTQSPPQSLRSSMQLIPDKP